MHPITAAIAENDPTTLAACQRLLAGDDEFALVAQCSTGRKVALKLKLFNPRILLINIDIFSIENFVEKMSQFSLDGSTIVITLADATIVENQQWDILATRAYGLLARD